MKSNPAHDTLKLSGSGLDGQMGAHGSDPAIESDRRRGFGPREEALERPEAGAIVRLQVENDRGRRKLVAFDCRVVNRMVHGTHTVFLGEVQQLLLGKKGKPLLYSEGQYAKLASLTLGEPLPEGLDYWGF